MLLTSVVVLGRCLLCCSVPIDLNELFCVGVNIDLCNFYYAIFYLLFVGAVYFVCMRPNFSIIPDAGPILLHLCISCFICVCCAY